jgi:hypothetical protein
MRDRIQDAIENGQRNQHILQLVHNWCGHVRARKQGVGLVEQMTGLPIGHMSLECPHARAGGMSAFELADTALDFHDRNCVDCKFRKPMGFPNLTELLAEREKRRNAERLERERQANETANRLALRKAARQSIRSTVDAISATTLDRIDELDCRDERAGQRLVETAKLAPETFTPVITDHLFELIDGREYGLVGPCLEAVTHLPVDSARLCNAALKALRSPANMELGGSIIEKHCANANPELIADALPSLVSLANPPSFHFGPGQQREPVVGPLKALYAHHKNAVQVGLKQMLEGKRPYIARLAALGLEALIPVDAALTSFLVPELIAKLARANRLLEGREDEIEDVLTDIHRVLTIDFKSDPAKVDQLIKDFLLGASDEGAAELYKIYDQVLRDVRFDDDKPAITEAHHVAFRRLVAAASVATTDEVQRATSGCFHGEPYDLAPIGIGQQHQSFERARYAAQRLRGSVGQMDAYDASRTLTVIGVSVHSLHASYTLAFKRCQFQGRSSSRRLAGCPSVMRCRTSLSQAKGSTLLSFAVAMREQTVAHRMPPPSEPANRWFLRPSAMGRMARSTGLLSSSMRPSSRKRVRASQRASA